MRSPRPLSLSSLRTIPLSERKKDCDERDFGAPYRGGGALADFLCSLPNRGAAGDLFCLRDAIITAHKHNRSVIVGCGGHVVDAGLSPLICRLIEQKVITGLALTGEALLQDVEIAFGGRTVGYRDQDLISGSFGVTEETGKLINDAINFAAIENLGIGKSVGQHLMNAELRHLDHSILATASRYGVPVTVHPVIGADAFNLHPLAHGESLGAAGMRDFRLLAAMMSEASSGVLLNVASSVVLPRVFLQAVDVARNLGKTIENLNTAVIDSSASEMAVTDIVERLSQLGGKGYCLQGSCEILLPLLFAAVLDALGCDFDTI